MRARSFGLTILSLAALAALFSVCPSCGKSSSAKAYDAYQAKVEPLLDREKALWRKMDALFRERLSDQSGDATKFGEFVTKEAIPFYEGMTGQVEDAAPSDPSLAEAQEALTQFTAASAGWARFLADNLDFFRHGDADEKLTTRGEAAEAARQEYESLTAGPAGVQDPRFLELRAISNDFAQLGMVPFTEGRATQQELQDLIRKSLLPRVKKLRTGQFPETPEGRALRESIASAEEFYATVADNVPHLDRNQKFGGEAARRAAECDRLRTKFVDAMKAARRRL